MRMLAVVSVLTLFASPPDCAGELVTDTGYACVIPAPAECDCEDSEPDQCSYDPLYNRGNCGGVLPPDTPLALQVWLGYGRGDSWDITCDVEDVGDRVLEIHASFRWKKDQDADGEPDVVADCEIGPLAAGDWTLRYGAGQTRLTVSDVKQPVPCVDSGKDR